MATSTASLPLPPRFFRCPSLSSEEIATFKYVAYKNAMELVRKAQVTSRTLVKWTQLSGDHGLKLYRGEDLSCPPGYSLHCAVLDVCASMAEIVDLFRTPCDVSANNQSHDQRFCPGTVDAAPLYSIVEPSRDFPRQKLCITWRAIAPPSLPHVATRDACLLESSHDFEYHGRRGWVQCMRSVDPATASTFCQSLQASHGLIRMTNHGPGRVFFDSVDKPGYIQVTYITHVNMHVTFREWVRDALGKLSFPNMLAKWRANPLGDIDRLVRESRLNRTPFLSAPHQFVSLASQSECHRCHRSFRMLREKFHCTKCGQVVCRRCNQHWTITIANTRTKKRICHDCALTGGPKLDHWDKHLADTSRSCSQTQTGEDSNVSSPTSSTGSDDGLPFDLDQCLDALTLAESFMSVNADTFLSTSAEAGESSGVEQPDDPVIAVKVGPSRWIDHHDMEQVHVDCHYSL